MIILRGDGWQMLGNAAWEHYMSMLDAKARERLARYRV